MRFEPKRLFADSAAAPAANDLPARSAVKVEETWNVDAIFADEAAFETMFRTVRDRLPGYASYQGRLKDEAVLLEFLNKANADSVDLGKVYVYAHLKRDQDTSDAKNAGLEMRTRQLFAEFMSALSFFRPELASWDEDDMSRLIKAEPKLEAFAKYLDDIIRFAPHTLSDGEEKLLAAFSPVLGSGASTFSTLTNADFVFPHIRDEEGKDIELTASRYSRLMQSTSRDVRKAAFAGMYKVYGQFQNTCAGTLAATVKRHNVEKDARHFPSARAMALFDNAVPEAVYDNLVSSVNQHIDLLHRYTAMRKARLGVEELHAYDMYPSLVKDVDVHFSFEEARALVMAALKPLGDDYLAILDDAFSSRWIDRAENRGKRSGAYSSGSYGTLPYILLNWQGKLGDVFTLAHELGHSVHSYLSNKTQPPHYADYSIFLAEIASTLNENLLSNYLLQQWDDPDKRLYVINEFVDGFKGTVFRQTQFAEFEQLIHEADNRGEAITAEFLTEHYGEMNRRYYGPALTFDPEIALEWSRIPHFYYNFYVYQYATGFAASSAFARRILAGEKGAVERYKDVLRAGSSDYPIEVLKKAGLDMSKPAVVEEALASFEAFLAEMEAAPL
ncbi:MAG TPA: oligoendopeptidase F [Clostridiaceae bacterium]|nr:oligoendopeptidase F [Clostridiaceae bacterium]